MTDVSFDTLAKAIQMLAENQKTLQEGQEKLSQAIETLQVRPILKEEDISHSIDIQIKEEALAVANAPKVQIDHRFPEAKVIGWNSQRIVVQPGLNMVPEMFAQMYQNWLQDIEYRDRRKKLLSGAKHTGTALASLLEEGRRS